MIVLQKYADYGELSIIGTPTLPFVYRKALTLKLPKKI